MRAEFLGPDGQRLSLPVRCTTLVEDDPYVQFAQPDDLFRLPDLVELADFVHLIARRGQPSEQDGDRTK